MKVQYCNKIPYDKTSLWTSKSISYNYNVTLLSVQNETHQCLQYFMIL